MSNLGQDKTSCAADSVRTGDMPLKPGISCGCTRISFVIPAYNEGEKVGTVLSELSANFPDHEILLVDDASTDNTAEVAGQLSAVRVLRHNKNRGPGGAIKTGISNASGDFIVIVDADGQHPIEEIRKVVDCISEYPEIDAVLTHRNNIYSSGTLRSLGKLLINFVVRQLTNEEIKDNNCGLRAFRREKIAPFLFLLPDGFSYVTTSTVLAHKEDFSIRWIDIRMQKRESGKSRLRMRDGVNTLLLVFRLIVVFDPMKFFTPLAIFSFFVGILSIIYNWFYYGGPGKNYIFFFLFGSLVFVLGLLSEQIAVLRKELLNLQSRK